MPKPLSSAKKNQVRRQRIRAAGIEEVLFELPIETRELIDGLKERQGLANRSQALLQLIELGRTATQQIT